MSALPTPIRKSQAKLQCTLVSHSLAQLASKVANLVLGLAVLDLSHDMLNQQNQGTAPSVPDPSSLHGDWGLGTRLGNIL